MSWFMFKDSGTYQPRGKKISGFENMIRPKVDLNWGLDEFQSPSTVDIKPYSKTPTNVSAKSNKLGIFKKSQEEELEKIMKDFDEKKKYENNNDLLVMDNQSTFSKINERVITQESQDRNDRIRFLQNSLLPVSIPANKRDSIGILLNHQKSERQNTIQSRVSRRSQSGNQKNESTFVFGDGKYNSFVAQEEHKKSFDEKLKEMYEYESLTKSRRVNQIGI